MELLNLHYLSLFTCLIFLLAQVLVKEKQIAHILFAAFCGSIAMTITQKVSGQSLGNYQYLIGMGACATCNCYWLLARSLFRGKKAIAIQHVAFALAIALLIMTKQGYLLANNAQLLTASANKVTHFILNELTLLLSSCVLVLSFWEGCRGFKAASKRSKAQRILFLATFATAVSVSKMSQGLLINSPQTQEVIMALIILMVLVNTQILLLWRFKKPQNHSPAKTSPTRRELQLVGISSDNGSSNSESPNNESSDTEDHLALQVKKLIIDGSLYLQANLKVADIARELDVPEYRISKALRNRLKARNFNQYVNELRIQHAQNLLADPNKQKWSVLVIGLESGFASVGPFTRAFKSQTGSTPNQYRQTQLSHSDSLLASRKVSGV